MQAGADDLLTAEEASALQAVALDRHTATGTSGLDHLAACLQDDAWLENEQVPCQP